MPLFSLSLPTLRQENAELVIKYIHDCSAGYDYEIVVVSPFEIRGPQIRHVPEPEARGNCSAHAAAYAASSGEYVITFTDDIIPTPGWLDGLQQTMEAKEAQHFPFCGGLHRANWLIYGTVYGLYYPYFPVLSRRSAEQIGGYFSEDYAAHFGDPDLAMRVWDAGGRCELIISAKIYGLLQFDRTNQAEHKQTSGERDMAMFKARWHARYGEAFGEGLRDFNIDYQLEDLYGATYMANAVFIEEALSRGDVSQEDLTATALTTFANSRRRITAMYETAAQEQDRARMNQLAEDLRGLAHKARHIIAGGAGADTDEEDPDGDGSKR